MIDLPMDSDATRAVQLGWQVDNDRGLALAAESDWTEAAEAFAGAADTLARALPSNATAHEPLALVLGNLAQAYFRAGRLDDAIQQAQRTCALRVALAGEDGMPVARARMDLAVMLAAAGRVDEAMALVQRAIAAIEHRVGDEDARLAIVLENAARIALAAAAPANAEPLLLRLHALLDAHGLSTARAEQLLARIAAVRARQTEEAAAHGGTENGVVTKPVASESGAVAPATITPVSAVLAEVQRTMAEQEAMDVASAEAALGAPSSEPPPMVELEPVEQALAEPDAPAAAPADDEFSTYLDSSLLPESDWEDQPLRDAVALTDVLLRSTPSGVPVIPEPVTDDATAAGPVAAEPEQTAPASIEPIAAEPAFTDLALDLADGFDQADTALSVDDLLEEFGTPPVELAPTVGVTNEKASTSASGADDIELDLAIDLPAAPDASSGFAFEHGVIDASLDDAMPASAPASAPVYDPLTAPLLRRPVEYAPAPVQPFPDHIPAPAEPPSPVRRVDITHAAPVVAPPVAPIADMVSTAPPSAADAGPAARPAGAPSRKTGQQASYPDRANNSAPRAERSASSGTSGGSSKLPFIIGGLVVAGGAAAWFLLR